MQLKYPDNTHTTNSTVDCRNLQEHIFIYTERSTCTAILEFPPKVLSNFLTRRFNTTKWPSRSGMRSGSWRNLEEFCVSPKGGELSLVLHINFSTMYSLMTNYIVFIFSGLIIKISMPSSFSYYLFNYLKK